METIIYRSEVVTEPCGKLWRGSVVIKAETGDTWKVSVIGPGSERDAQAAAIRAYERILEYGVCSVKDRTDAAGYRCVTSYWGKTW